MPEKPGPHEDLPHHKEKASELSERAVAWGAETSASVLADPKDHRSPPHLGWNMGASQIDRDVVPKAWYHLQKAYLESAILFMRDSKKTELGLEIPEQGQHYLGNLIRELGYLIRGAENPVLSDNDLKDWPKWMQEASEILLQIGDVRAARFDEHPKESSEDLEVARDVQMDKLHTDFLDATKDVQFRTEQERKEGAAIVKSAFEKAAENAP